MNGVPVITISENYENKKVVSDFIELCKANGLNATIDREFMFEQANVRL